MQVIKKTTWRDCKCAFILEWYISAIITRRHFRRKQLIIRFLHSKSQRGNKNTISTELENCCGGYSYAYSKVWAIAIKSSKSRCEWRPKNPRHPKQKIRRGGCKAPYQHTSTPWNLSLAAVAIIGGHLLYGRFKWTF
jgi:hypothetical protein